MSGPDNTSATPAAPAQPAAHQPSATTPLDPATFQRDAEAADDAAVTAMFSAPASPSDYQLPVHDAQQKGLQVDFAAEAELRSAMHAAGVDGTLASSLYMLAMNAARNEPTPLSLAIDYTSGERSLRQAWGADFDANLKAANSEGRRLFDAMPESVRRGMTYAEYARAAGFANSAPIAKMLLARAQGRSRSSKTSR